MVLIQIQFITLSIQVNGEEVHDDWDRNNDFKNEAKIKNYFENNRSIFPKEHVNVDDMTNGYLVLSFNSGEPSKIPETIQIIDYDELGLPIIDNTNITLKKKNRVI